ncbi:MAG: glycoside hydrolase family 19 protein [Azospirillum sp.]|nr:glycoside hydrolase family 19 protein [Azospirillum sp.]MCA3265471.1 glycoside hydrolase family 19 protein [Azospirillum sp.]
MTIPTGALRGAPPPEFVHPFGPALTAAGCADPVRHARWLGPLAAAARRFEIVRRERVAHFLAQLGHESGGLTRLEENLRYATAGRLCAVWPSRFATEADARPFVGNPEALANLVYSNRNGNGPIASGDGWRYRGRGPIQLTGRANYRAAARALDIPLESEPERALDPWVGSLIAGWFWWENSLNRLADGGPDALKDITRRINGGLHGLDDRRRRYDAAREALGPFPEMLEV